jgi:ribosomal protein S27E
MLHSFPTRRSSDLDGLYLEQLLPWQLDIARTECSGQLVSVANTTGVIAAARGRGDNFVVTVRCGKCSHEWYDGVRYQNVTTVRCPSCAAVNGVDSSGVVVH